MSSASGLTGATPSGGSENPSSSVGGGTLGSDATSSSLGSEGATGMNTGENSEDSSSPESVWGECPERYLGQCRRLAVPLDWDLGAEQSSQLELLISRHQASQARQGQIWLLAGGPGGSGNELFEIAQSLSKEVPSFDIFVLEHRGVGESGRLSCPLQESKDSPMGFDIAAAEWPDCIAWLAEKWGPDLHAFNTTFAARDLKAAIRSHAQPGESVYVYGQSYGTMLAMRHMMVEDADSPVTGYILDSVLSPKEIYIENFDAQIDPVARDLGALCAKYEGCRGYMGDKPWETLQTTFQSLDSGHCRALELDRKAASELASILAFNADFRKFLYPVAYRIARCSEADIAALSQVFDYLSKLWNSPLPSLPSYSPVLQNNILFAEVAHIPSTPLEELRKRCNEELTLCPEISTKWIENWRIWPRYLPDQWSGRWPEFKVPVLAMNGDMDPQTPYNDASVIDKHLKGSAQNYVQFPHAAHIVLQSTPVKREGAPTCGMQVMSSFLKNPHTRPDLSCLGDLKAEDFTPPAALIEMMFGTTSLWENEARRSATTAIPTREDWYRLFSVARQRGVYRP